MNEQMVNVVKQDY